MSRDSSAVAAIGVLEGLESRGDGRGWRVVRGREWPRYSGLYKKRLVERVLLQGGGSRVRRSVLGEAFLLVGSFEEKAAILTAGRGTRDGCLALASGRECLDKRVWNALWERRWVWLRRPPEKPMGSFVLQDAGIRAAAFFSLKG